ncbi:MAG TPA: hypothetical protein DCZ01_00885 [Elusimicrobia bacterium]|nr:MAG: hypothetical protein A2X37_03855 [Elusimicrobia bacterium GWA2_66_18]OGR72456.1 MAG: hypothetical protein A2X40_09580 [Elusimicrobia bacterium GWC2_65_9]HAZ07087.1 hypothetical protein [Elusimicrobiota bacterium]
MTLSILLLAASAHAQLRPIVPSFPGANNPVVLLPKTLPSPFTGMTIQLPARSIAPALDLPAISLPTPAAIIRIHIRADRENVVNPIRRIVSVVNAQFDERKEAPRAQAEQDAEKDRLDHLFDGDASPNSQPPARSGHRVNLPELELERELGL